MAKSYGYDAWGNEASADPGDANPWRYCGGHGYYFDRETATYMTQFRSYQPTTGRYLSEDPYWAIQRIYWHTPQGLNLYVYCGNNSIMYIDPSGLDYYVYYGSDQKWAAKQYEKQLNKDYKGVPVHMILVDNPDTFYQRWGAMGIENGKEVNIDGVIINVHGNPTNFYASDGKKIDLSQTSNDRSIPTLLLLVCNAGNLDYDNNVAVQFLKAFNIGNVVAPDGYHWRHEFHGIFGINANVKNSVSKYDSTGILF